MKLVNDNAEAAIEFDDSSDSNTSLAVRARDGAGAATKSNPLYAKQFSRLLRWFVEDCGLNQEELATILKRPRSTVTKWLNEVQCPPRTRLKDLCKLIEFDYESLFLPDVHFDQWYQEKFFSFNSVNRRYLRWLPKSPFKALKCLGFAGVEAHHFLLALEIPCFLRVTADSRVSITTCGLAVPWRFELKGDPSKGIMIQCFHDSDNCPLDPQSDWVLLDETGLARFGDCLKAINSESLQLSA